MGEFPSEILFEKPKIKILNPEWKQGNIIHTHIYPK